MTRNGELDYIDREIIRMRGIIPSREMVAYLTIHETSVLKRITILLRTGHLDRFDRGKGARQQATPRRCLSCGKDFQSVHRNALHRICPGCSKSHERTDR